MAFKNGLVVLAICLLGLGGRPVVADDGLYEQAMQLIAEGRYGEANAVLRRLVSAEPEHAGAWLDIAILQCSIGNAEEAEALFATIESRFSPPPAIREVIAQQRARGCRRELPEASARVRLGRGYDDNVNQGARNLNFSIGSGGSLINLVLTPDFAPKADHFTGLTSDYVQPLTPEETQGFVQFQARRYDNYSDYDLGSLIAGVEVPWRSGDWQWRGSAALGALTLGGNLYQRQGQAQLQLTPPQALPAGWEASGAAGWTRIGYPTLSSFDSQIWDARGLLTYRSSDTYALGSVGYAYDHGTTQRPGGDRRGLVASLTARRRVAGEMLAELGWNLQNWNGERVYSPGLIDVAREQSTRLLRAALIVPLGAQQAIHLEYRNVRNRENISLFEYREQMLQLSWQWQTGP